MTTHRLSLPLQRRAFLAGTALAASGLPAWAAAQTRITFSGWAFEPQVTEADVKLFMQQNPEISVDYTPLDMQSYNQKMIALFVAGSQPDSFYIHDTDLGAWVEAGWVDPIDGMSGQEVTTEKFINSYQEKAGMKIARKVEIVKDGKVFMDIEIIEVQPLEKLDDSVFAKP